MKAPSLKNLVLEAKIPEEDLDQIHTMAQDGADPSGAISHLGKKFKVNPQEVESAFKKRFGKSPGDMAKENQPDGDD